MDPLLTYPCRRKSSELHRPPGDFISHLSLDWSIILIGLVPSFIGDDAETDDLFNGDEAMFAVWQDLIQLSPVLLKISIFRLTHILPSPTWFYFRFCTPFIVCCQYSISNPTSPPTSIINPIILDDDDDSNESCIAIADISSFNI
jgi:hypothetical protein